MNDNELDDLFRSNADYLADQPSRDFDKDAFWQQMQPSIPRKADRKNPRVWGWAAAVVLLAGIAGSIGWMQWASKQGKPELAQQAENIPAPKSTERIARVPREITPAIESEKHTSLLPRASVDGGSQGQGTPPRNPEKPAQEIPIPSPLPETKPVNLAIREFVQPDTIKGADDSLSEPTIPTASEKPTYRVVHINEIRARKQQEAKARTRMALRIWLSSGTRMTTQSDQGAPLSIPIQN